MTGPVLERLLDRIELRERQLAEQAGELAARLRELAAEREALQVTGKTLRAMAADLQLEAPPAPALPDGAANQRIMGVFDHERRALRARDLCLALDLPVRPKHTESTRAKLKRLVSLGLLDETEPALFTQPRPRSTINRTKTFDNALSGMSCWQDFEWVTLAMMPMFLFSTTFFPLGVYPRWLQLFVECTPLYQGIEIVRGLMLGSIGPELLGRAVYLAILGSVGLAVSARRLGRLLTS